MKEEHIVRYSRESLPQGRTDWERVRRMTEDEIEVTAQADPDAPLTDESFWKDAEMVVPEETASVTLCLDRDVLDWFGMRNEGCQASINVALRDYMVRHKEKAG